MPQIIHLAQTDSTNTYLRQQLMAHPDLEEGSVVWADYQRAGRGQKGNSWESEEKANLLFTLLLCPDSIRARDQFIISQLVSLGMIDVLNNLHEGFSVKWPNDIYYHDKKAVGILIENDMAGQNLINSFIGIGLNVNQKKIRQRCAQSSIAVSDSREGDRTRAVADANHRTNLILLSDGV
jgi:birA, biotin-[acetyl-CoA-carboxylase] ligase region